MMEEISLYYVVVAWSDRPGRESWLGPFLDRGVAEAEAATPPAQGGRIDIIAVPAVLVSRTHYPTP